MKLRVFLPFSILFILILSSACSTQAGEHNPATATAQVERSVHLATQMAQSLQATNQVRFAYTTATAEAQQSLLDAVLLWPVVYSDRFEVDNDNWPTGEDEDTLATINWSIDGGKYNWHAQANGGFVWWTIPESVPVSNFYMAADIRLVEGPEDAEMGLVYRNDGDRSYYNFGITGDGKYSVYLHSPDGWEALLDWSPSADLNLGSTNRLSVIAQGDQFLFFINDRYQITLQDDRLSSGEAGLIIGLSMAGEEGVWEFDNYELRSPTTDQLEALKIKTTPDP